MSIYRVKQFLWFIFARVDEKDIAFLKEFLDDKDMSLFKRLSPPEQKHSIRVARMLKSEVSINSNINTSNENLTSLVKVALMHDIGKIYKRLNVIDKSILVIMNKVTKGRLRRFKNNKKVYVYYYHAEKGESILRNYGFSENALFLVRNHHNDSIKGNSELDILKYCDSMN